MYMGKDTNATLFSAGCVLSATIGLSVCGGCAQPGTISSADLTAQYSGLLVNYYPLTGHILADKQA